MKEMLKKVMVIGMVVMGSSVAMADDGGHDGDRYEEYTEKLEKQFFMELEEDKNIREVEIEVEDIAGLMLVEVEVEAPNKVSDDYLLDKIEPAVEKATAQLKEDFERKMRVVIEREDKILKSEMK